MINRHAWDDAVAQTNLPDRAKTLASALRRFANDQTGQCNPSIPTLAAYLKRTEQTVRNAIHDLTEAGWLARLPGNGKGNVTKFVMLSPGNVVALRPAPIARDATTVSLKGSKDFGNRPAQKGQRTLPKGSKDFDRHIRKEHHSEQKARASEPPPHPESRLCVKVERGSWQADAWGKWLWSHGKPSLDEMPAFGLVNGYRLPWSTPPSDGDTTGERILDHVIEWAMNHQSKGAKHERAA